MTLGKLFTRTHVPLSPRSVILYRPRCDALWLEGLLQPADLAAYPTTGFITDCLGMGISSGHNTLRCRFNYVALIVLSNSCWNVISHCCCSLPREWFWTWKHCGWRVNRECQRSASCRWVLIPQKISNDLPSPNQSVQTACVDSTWDILHAVWVSDESGINFYSTFQMY